MTRTVLVVRHTERGSLGLYAAPLGAAGATPVLWDAFAEDEPPARLDAFDALLVLGGVMNPDEDDAYPWLARTRAALLEAIDLGQPVLGVCLGAQLLAQALGGEAPPCEPEVGWHGVELEPAAADDPLLADLPSPFTTFHWHSYGCVPPADATSLATSRHALQAFRVGARTWGVQFHGEVGTELAELWARRGAGSLRRHGLEAEDVIAGAARHASVQRRVAEAIAGGFGRVVAEA